jgi:hypothetical protein
MKIIYNALFGLYASILKNGEYVCVNIFCIFYGGPCGVTPWEAHSCKVSESLFLTWICLTRGWYALHRSHRTL